MTAGLADSAEGPHRVVGDETFCQLGSCGGSESPYRPAHRHSATLSRKGTR